MKAKLLTAMVFVACASLLAACGWQKFPEDRYVNPNPPAPPASIVTITPGIQQIYVEWTVSPDAAILGYNIYTSTDAGSSWDAGQHVPNRLTTTLTITQDGSGTTLDHGTTYLVQIRSLSLANVESEISLSPTASATTAPAPVSGFTGQGQNQQVVLDWTYSVSTTVVGYHVYIESSPGTWTLLSYLDGQLMSIAPALPIIVDRDHTGTSLVPGAQYSFRVTAYDNTGLESSPVDAMNIDVFPEEVTNLRATGGDQRIYLNWNPVGDPNADYYIITVTPTNPPGTALTPVQVASSATGYTALGLTNGTTYDCLVQTHLLTGATSPGVTASAIPTSTVDNTPPDDPTNFTAVPGDGQVSLTWTGSVSADAVGYELGYKESSASTYTIVVLSFVVAHTVTGLTNGVGYDFLLRALDPAGNKSIPGAFTTATPGRPSVGVHYNWPGGAYRHVQPPPSTDSTMPEYLILTGTVNDNPATGGTIYYTLDGTNPSITGPSAANPFTVNLRTLADTSINNYVIVKALFYDAAGGNGYGLTQSHTYFFFDVPQDTYISMGGMVFARRHHSATLIRQSGSSILDDIVIFGGRLPESTTVYDSSELFDHNVEFFRYGRTVTLQTPRSNHCAVELDDGTILLVGGRNLINLGGDVTTELIRNDGVTFFDPFIEIFDPANPTAATTTVDSPDGRILHQATLLTDRSTNNKVLISGGIMLDAANNSGPWTANQGSTGGAVKVSGDQTGTILPHFLVRFVSGTVAGETAFVSHATFAASSGETTVYISPSVASNPSGATFLVYGLQSSRADIYDPVAGAVVPAGAIPQERYGHTATLLQDGRVFIAGGHYNWQHTETEKVTLIYDPALDSFRVAGTGVSGSYTDNSARLQSRRFFHQATLLKDGKVLVSGGIDNPHGFFNGAFRDGMFYGSILSSCDVYDPVTETTVKTGNMITPRFFHVALLMSNGQVFISGGIDFRTSSGVPDPTNKCEIYDPVSGSYSSTGSMILARWGHQVTALKDGRILITGGSKHLLPEIYDPVTGKFTPAAGTLIYDRQIGARTTKLQDGTILVTGGQGRNYLSRQAGYEVAGPIHEVAELFDPAVSQFTVIQDKMTEPRKEHTATLLDDGRVLIAGGVGGDAVNPNPLASTEIFDQNAQTFTSSATLSGIRYGHTATVLNGERLYTVGTAAFDGTTTVLGTGTNWAAPEVMAGDRIRYNADTNVAFFEIVSVDSLTQLTIRSGAGHGFAIPTGSGAYTVRTERPYTAGTATFTFNSYAVTGTGTLWSVNLRVGDLIRPDSYTKRWFKIATIDVNNTSLTLTEPFAGPTSAAAEAYTARGNGKVLLAGGGVAGAPLRTGEVYDPYADTFSTVKNSMAFGRYDHTATLLSNGWVLIVGGASNYDITAELYDPACNRFKDISNLTTQHRTFTQAARNNHKALLMNNGYVYVMGGEIAQNQTEYFVPDVDGNAAADYDGDGIAGLDIADPVTVPGETNFFLLTNNLNYGRVFHTADRVVGTYSRGQAVFTNGSNAVTGIGTFWATSGLAVGDYIRPHSSSAWYQIQSINTDLSITLQSNFQGVTTPSAALGETYVAGPERVLGTGGVTGAALDSGELVTWNPAAPAASAVSAVLPLPTGRSMRSQTSIELDANGNVLLIKGHTIVFFLSR
jgi:hypothetical protein